MRVTAAVAREQGAALTVEILELDDLPANDVRVRMAASGVCHTDAVRSRAI
jgi:aryl-alcohol dehydrogenase